MQHVGSRTALIRRRHCIGLIAGGFGAAVLGIRPPAFAQSALDDLIKAAKAEGELTAYLGPTENVSRRIAGAFAVKYAIKVNYTRIDAGPQVMRFSAEAEAGTFAADLMMFSGGAQTFAKMGEGKGWIGSVSKAALPIIEGGQFPARMNLGRTAIVQISPWLIAFNTERVKGTDVPKAYADLIAPKWKGQILVNDPGIAESYVDFWALIADTYGPQFLEQLRPNIHVATNPVAGTQALGAGEGAFQMPALIQQVASVKDKGGPLDTVTMDVTSGVEMQIILTDQGKAKHPNAARLFANYLLSPEGNAVFNADPGTSTIYAANNLPAKYRSPIEGISARKEEIRKLLGFS